MKRTFACEAKLVLFVGVVAELRQEGLDTGWTRVGAHDVDAVVAVSRTNNVHLLDPAGAVRWFPIHCGPSYRTGILTGLEGAPQGEGDHYAVSATAFGAVDVAAVVAVGYYGDAVAVAIAGVSVDSGSVDVAAVVAAVAVVAVAVLEIAG